MEIWKSIEGHDNYQVSSYGRVKRVDMIRKKIYKGKYNGKVVSQFYPEIMINTSLNNHGYKRMCFNCDGKQKTIEIHRLVAFAFVDGYREGYTVNHKDGNRLNNDASNLEWCTIKENLQHAHRTGLIKVNKGEQCHQAKLKSTDVIEIIRLNKEYKLSQAKLSVKYNVSKGTIQNIIDGKTWKSINRRVYGNA